MSQLPSVGGASAAASSRSGGSSGQATDLRDVDLDQFLQLLISELQNQDPLNPLDNSEILQQISQIREIGATNQLNETLQAVQTGQNLTTASSLIGKRVEALSDDGTRVTGVVDRVSVDTSDQATGRRLRVHVGGEEIALENVGQILDADAELPALIGGAA